MICSLDAHGYLRARMTACSFQSGWRSLLLRAYEDPPEVEPFTTPATADHLIVLVTDGACNIEGLYRGRWQSATYGAGSIGMTAPGEEVTLRWHGTNRHSTLQLHISAEMIRSCGQDLTSGNAEPHMPNALGYDDPLLRSVILDMAARMAQGVPDLYAESAAHFLAMHLLVRHADCRLHKTPARDSRRLRRVDDYMNANLAEGISLRDLANVACLSTFGLIRVFKQAYGETPYQRLTRLRIERARQLLRLSEKRVADVAVECGFVSHAHFAAVFRRAVGVTPTAYRQSLPR
jgi:AraC family transcriptional regulator